MKNSKFYFIAVCHATTPFSLGVYSLTNFVKDIDVEVIFVGGDVKQFDINFDYIDLDKIRKLIEIPC